MAREEQEEKLLDDLGEEVGPQDDAVIGKAFRWSLGVLVLIGAIAALVLLLGKGKGEAGPEQAIEKEAPQAVAGATEAPSFPFKDVTRESGVTFVHFNGARGEKLLPETMGSGVAVFDYDGDGDQDLLFVNGAPWPDAPESSEPGSLESGTKPTLGLYRNDGRGNFQDVTTAAGLDRVLYGVGVAVADIDADGWPDVFVSAVGENLLLRNREGVFEDITARAGVAGSAEEWSTGAGFFDYDGDGDLDLLVCNYVRWSKKIDLELDFRLTGVGRAYGPPQSFEGTFPYLYRNEGDGRFEDVSEEAGVRIQTDATGLPMAKSLALGLADVDGDGLMDVLVANDTVRNFFFHNQGEGRFEETGEFFGVAYDRNGNATGAMGVDASYYRNGQNLGFVIGNFANEMTSIYVAQDDPTFFVDDSISEGVGAPSRLKLSFGVVFLDADLDGRLDLLQANGHLEDEISTVDPSQSYFQAPQLFWNAGAEAGFQMVDGDKTGDLGKEIVGRSVAYGDFDSDGDLDTVFTQVSGPPLLLRNDQELGHHWLRVKLRGQAPNRDAIGAWATLRSGGVTQRRQVMPTRSYLAQVELPLTFGLGDATTVDSLEITWPDGTTQSVDVAASGGIDRQIEVQQDPIPQDG